MILEDKLQVFGMFQIYFLNSDGSIWEDVAQDDKESHVHVHIVLCNIYFMSHSGTSHQLQNKNITDR